MAGSQWYAQDSSQDGGPLATQQASEFVLAHRAVEKVSLREVAISSTEIGGLIPGFHPFGDDLHPEDVRHLQDCVDEDWTLRGRPDVIDERFIHLEPVEREIT